ncbi:MAG: 7-carboxy-7-deazaguanine synthase QueE [Candidatus Omnitrophota bacterium]
MNKDALKADVIEIFSSVQGEGPFMGVKQIFLRFARCNLNCRFCDLKKPFSSKEFSVSKMISIVKQISQNSGEHHSISLTGGEPLMYRDYLKALLPELKEMGHKIYLETNSTLVDSLKDVLDLVDIVAADFKLPSSTGVGEYWREHKAFIGLAKKKNCFVKIVITNQTEAKDVKKAIDIISKVDGNMLMVLQPVWPVEGVERAKNKQLFDYLFLAEKRLKNVRIMPQMHKVLGVR